MPETLKLSAQGVPQWFSPQHAGEKFKEICLGLVQVAMDAKKAKKKGLADKIWAIQEEAEKYAKYYYCKSPVQSVRVMHPSGAIYVILADGREVAVPQP